MADSEREGPAMAGGERSAPFKTLADACVAEDWPKAIRILSSLISQEPHRSASLLCSRAFCHLQLDLYKHALKDCATALSLDPLAYRAYLYKGHALAGLGKRQDSVQTWKQGYEVVVNHFGCIELLQQFHTLAINSQKEISETNVKGTTGAELFNFTHNQELSGFPKEAKSKPSVCIADMEIGSSTGKAFEVSSPQASSSVTGSPQSNLFQSKEQLQVPNKNVSNRISDSLSLDLRLSSGIAQVNMGKYDEAITTFDQILKGYLQSVDALLGRGAALAFKRDLEAAIADFSKVPSCD